eukprot:176238-Rhodomonas_salina.1
MSKADRSEDIRAQRCSDNAPSDVLVAPSRARQARTLIDSRDADPCKTYTTRGVAEVLLGRHFDVVEQDSDVAAWARGYEFELDIHQEVCTQPTVCDHEGHGVLSESVREGLAEVRGSLDIDLCRARASLHAYDNVVAIARPARRHRHLKGSRHPIRLKVPVYQIAVRCRKRAGVARRAPRGVEIVALAARETRRGSRLVRERVDTAGLARAVSRHRPQVVLPRCTLDARAPVWPDPACVAHT